MRYDPALPKNWQQASFAALRAAIKCSGERLAVRAGFVEDLERWLVDQRDEPDTKDFRQAAKLWVLIQPPRTPQALARFLQMIPPKLWGAFQGMTLPEDQATQADGLSCADRSILLRVRLRHMEHTDKLEHLHAVAKAAPELLHPDQGITDAEIRGILRETRSAIEDWPEIMRDQVWRATRAHCWDHDSETKVLAAELRLDIPGWFERIAAVPQAKRDANWRLSLRVWMREAGPADIDSLLPRLNGVSYQIEKVLSVGQAPLTPEQREALERQLASRVNAETPRDALAGLLVNRRSLAEKIYPRLTPTQGLGVTSKTTPPVAPELAAHWVLNGDLNKETVRGFLYLVVKHALYAQASHRFDDPLITMARIKATGLNMRFDTSGKLLVRYAEGCLEDFANKDTDAWPNWLHLVNQSPKSADAWSDIEARHPGWLAWVLDQHASRLNDPRNTLSFLEYTPEMGFLAFLADVVVPGDAMSRYQAACQNAPDADRLALFRETLLDGLRQEMRGVEMVAPGMSTEETVAIWANMVERVRRERNTEARVAMSSGCGVN